MTTTQSNVAVDAGFTWPSDANYLAIAVNPTGAGVNVGEELHIIRNPRLGSGLLNNTPVTAKRVNDSIGGSSSARDPEAIGFEIRDGIEIFLGRTSSNRALFASSLAATSPMPLTIARI